MKNNKGFTLVEIIVSFSLTMIVVLFLFQIILTLKQVYTNNFVVSDLKIKQGNIVKMINNDFSMSNLEDVVGITPSNNNCYVITFSNDTRNICYDNKNNVLIYNDYEFSLVEGSIVGNLNVYIDSGILFIDIPITYRDIDGDFGIKMYYNNSI